MQSTAVHPTTELRSSASASRTPTAPTSFLVLLLNFLQLAEPPFANMACCLSVAFNPLTARSFYDMDSNLWSAVQDARQILWVAVRGSRNSFRTEALHSRPDNVNAAILRWHIVGCRCMLFFFRYVYVYIGVLTYTYMRLCVYTYIYIYIHTHI